MSGPISGQFTLRCNSCQAVVYSSDGEPPPDHMAALTRFADSQCPRGGTEGGCPNTSVARDNATGRHPGRMRALLDELRTLADSLRPVAAGAEAEHRALRDRIEQVAARAEQIGGRVEQVAATHTNQLATHDGQLAIHDAQLATLSGQIGTMTSQIAPLIMRQPVVRLSRDQALAPLAVNATRTLTFTWPLPMASSTYDVVLTDERLVITTTTSKTDAAVTVTVRAVAAVTVTTIAALAIGWSA